MLKAEMLAVLFVLGGFVPLIDADLTLKILQPEDGVLTGRFLDSLLLNVPSCDIFAGQNVDIEYNNTNTNENKNLTNIFKVPNCTDTPRTFYQLMNLNSGTQYRLVYGNLTSSGRLNCNFVKVCVCVSGSNNQLHSIFSLQYKVGANHSTIINASTLTATDYNEINDGLPARSGAMVVITVILSVAMFFLLICLIVSTALSTN